MDAKACKRKGGKYSLKTRKCNINNPKRGKNMTLEIPSDYNKKDLIEGLQHVYDNHRLSEYEEGIVLTTIEGFGGSINW